MLHLPVVRVGRAPLLVADDHGVRVRRGETWRGLPWQDIEHVEVQSASSWWREGRIVVHPRQDDGSTSRSGPGHLRWNGHWSVPLA